MSKMTRFLWFVTVALVVSALGFSGTLLFKDIGMGALQESGRSWFSAMSLLFVGVAFLMAQPMMRLEPREFVKNVLLAGTFLLWGMVQLMPQNLLSMRLGSLVVVLFVLDLAWVTIAGMQRPHSAKTTRLAALCVSTLTEKQSHHCQMVSTE